MKLNRFASALVAVVLVVPAVFAAEDLTGKWAGSFVISMDGNPGKEDVVHMVVATHKGADLTGTIGPNPNEQMEIVNGKVVTTKEAGKEVTKVTFQAVADGESIHFDLALIEGRLKGKAKAEHDGHTMSVVVDMTRLK
jgi:hypothetical protein